MKTELRRQRLKRHMRHDLHEYIGQLSAKMEAEYARIRKSSTADPGTAGDEGEENWAQLLREWLPTSYRVVTKGQMLDSQGVLSRQVDVIVLKPSYPPALHTKKKYLLAGVAAAFECKLTLRGSDVSDAVSKMACIKRMVRPSSGTPYRELMTSPICGLLAHSYQQSRKKQLTGASSTISKLIETADSEHVHAPREMIDLVCISNLATWGASKEPLADPADEIDPQYRAGLDPRGTPATTYMCHDGHDELRTKNPLFSPLGVFVTELLVKLAWEDASLRDVASYFVGVEFSTSATGMSRKWPRTIYSHALRKELSLKRLKQDLEWDEWAWSIE